MKQAILSQFKVKAWDGIDLFCVKNEAEKENGIIIIIHGLAEYLNRYDYVAEKFQNANLTVYRYDNRGHGRSGGERADLNDFNDFIKDANSIVEYVKTNNPNIPIFMLGHSMGGFIAAGYGVKYKNKINGQVLSGAATMEAKQIKGILGYFIKISNKIVPKLKIKNNLADNISRNIEVVNNYKEDPLVLKKVTSKFYYEFLIRGTSWLVNNLVEYKYPCLVLHGGEDKIVSNEASTNFINSISSIDKELKIYNGLYHEILNEKERDTIINDIISWIYSRI